LGSRRGAELERGKGRRPGGTSIRLLTRGVGRPTAVYGTAAGRMGGGGAASGGRRVSLEWAGLGQELGRLQKKSQEK
jgi:hypothetical protein